MREDELTNAVIREWLVKAENDLKNAVHTLKMGEDCPTDTVCFHAQQCAEKYLKALLVMLRSDFPKTHNIEDLLALVPEDLLPELPPEDQDRLTEYATITRYPGDYEEIPLIEARRAVTLARRVRSHVRKLLPKNVVRWRRSR